MEQIRVDCISSEKYGELGEDLIEHAKMKMQNNIDLRKSMEAVFENCSTDDEVVIYLSYMVKYHMTLSKNKILIQHAKMQYTIYYPTCF